MCTLWLCVRQSRVYTEGAPYVLRGDVSTAKAQLQARYAFARQPPRAPLMWQLKKTISMLRHTVTANSEMLALLVR